MSYIKDIELGQSLYIIGEVIKEYNDSRIFQKYCFDNLLLQVVGENLSYKEYKEKIRLENTLNSENNTAIKEEDIKNRKDNASKLLASFLNEKK
ncbi:Uncharacterised protein [Clostridium paraputrificum]|uniref:hypothetical protein n=1 Tax=Clostridium paraputrificum TaxID=29363 RepID=UPI000D971A45|nr:hypothetical protein [Clostridium paraputrificum]SQB99782.1 Uncharacterised protein [Clostridium paraputrificum]